MLTMNTMKMMRISNEFIYKRDRLDFAKTRSLCQKCSTTKATAASSFSSISSSLSPTTVDCDFLSDFPIFRDSWQSFHRHFLAFLILLLLFTHHFPWDNPELAVQGVQIPFIVL